MILEESIFIKVRTVFKATHRWEGCNIKDVMFLRYPHHHEFQIEATILITHSDRDIEFITYQRWLDNFLLETYPNHSLGNMSCEMLASVICDATMIEFKATNVKIEVNEDGHYGGIVHKKEMQCRVK